MTDPTYRPLTPRAQEAIAREVPIIEAALVRLRQAMDDEVHHCEQCHLPVRRSFNDWQIAEQIDGMLGKLLRWMGRVETRAGHVTPREPPASTGGRSRS